MDSLVINQDFWRGLFSFGGLVAFWGISLLIPFRRDKALQNPKRWLTNLTLTFGNAFLVRLLVPISLVQVASSNDLKDYAIFDLSSLAPGLSFALGLVILDMALYWQHRLTHQIPILWRLHRVHHSDIDFDTTLAGRFHTFEILFSFAFKGLFVVAFHLSPATIVGFEILLNFSSLFNHSNFDFPKPIEKVLRLFLITPGLHRIHHSTFREEMNSNYGFSTSVWDRLFFSYTEKGQENPKTMKIGLNQFRDDDQQSLWQLLLQPFRN